MIPSIVSVGTKNVNSRRVYIQYRWARRPIKFSLRRRSSVTIDGRLQGDRGLHWHQIGRLQRIKTESEAEAARIVGGKSLVDGKKRWRDGGLESRGVLVLRVVKRGDKGNGERAKREQ